MKKIYKLLWVAGIIAAANFFENTQAYASCDTTGCDATNFSANLAGSPDTSWTVTTARNGFCCGAGGTINVSELMLPLIPRQNLLNWK